MGRIGMNLQLVYMPPVAKAEIALSLFPALIMQAARAAQSPLLEELYV